MAQDIQPITRPVRNCCKLSMLWEENGTFNIWNLQNEMAGNDIPWRYITDLNNTETGTVEEKSNEALFIRVGS